MIYRRGTPGLSRLANPGLRKTDSRGERNQETLIWFWHDCRRTSGGGYQEGETIADIFLVDDEEFIIELYRDILESKGHKVVAVAGDGEEAVRKYKGLGEKPVIVIMDQRMPVKDGVTATQEILTFDPDAKILFGSADLQVKSDALRAGAKDFLLKPFRIEALLKAIEELESEQVTVS
jgi:two-component system chemotaxis response regulator CheY